MMAIFRPKPANIDAGHEEHRATQVDSLVTGQFGNRNVSIAMEGPKAHMALTRNG